MKRIIIVGGGYAGTRLARALDSVAEVVLVEAREAFVHNVATGRAVVDPATLEQLIIPYDRMLQHGRVVHERVVVVTEKGVGLSGGSSLEGDFVVVATGSRSGRPFKPATDSIATFREDVKSAQEHVRAAKVIAIVGGGAVGIELAGEIAAAMPSKRVELVSATPTLFPQLKPGFGRKLQGELASLGVKLHLGAKAEGLRDLERPQPGALSLASGTIDSDVIFPAVGVKPVTSAVSTLAGVVLESSGRVKVDGWLRIAGRPNVFAVGDLAATGEPMTIVSLSNQVPWLAKTLIAALEGKRIEDLPTYRPKVKPMLLVPVGATRGASVLPVTGQGWVVGAFLTSKLKGQSLFIPRYRKEMGYD